MGFSMLNFVDIFDEDCLAGARRQKEDEVNRV